MKAIITFEDLPNGELSTRFEFDPAVDDNTPDSPAINRALAIMDALKGDNDDSE